MASTPTDLPVVGRLAGAVLERVITSSGSSSSAGRRAVQQRGEGCSGRESAALLCPVGAAAAAGKGGQQANRRARGCRCRSTSSSCWRLLPTQQLLGGSGVQRLHGLAAELAAACLQTDVAVALGALACKVGAARGQGWGRCQMQGVRPRGSGRGAASAWLPWQTLQLQVAGGGPVDANGTAISQPASRDSWGAHVSPSSSHTQT